MSSLAHAFSSCHSCTAARLAQEQPRVSPQALQVCKSVTQFSKKLFCPTITRFAIGRKDHDMVKALFDPCEKAQSPPGVTKSSLMLRAALVTYVLALL
jgi:hypothetical protein